MSFQVTSDNLEITPSMKTLAEDKVSRILNKIKDVPEDLIDLRVVLNKGAGDGEFKSKVELSVGGIVVVGIDKDYTLESSLIKAVDDTLRQYEKVKDKRKEQEWEGRRQLKKFIPDEEV